VVAKDSARGAPVTAAERARQHFLAAQDRRAHFDDAGMWRELRAAWAADASYLPAFREPLLGNYSWRHLAEMESVALALPDSGLGVCLRHMVAMRRQGANIRLIPVARASVAARACTAEYEFYHEHSVPERNRVAPARDLWRRFPDSPYYTQAYLTALEVTQEWEPALRLAGELAESSPNPFVRSVAYGDLSFALHQNGRHGEAVQWEQRATLDTRRSPGVRLVLLERMLDLHTTLVRGAGADSALARHSRTVIADAARELGLLIQRADLWTSLSHRIAHAERLLDHGDLLASVREWTGLARVADELDEPQLMAMALVRRGRTLVKLGRVPEAEADLLAGRLAARRASDLRWQYEAEHNLLHLYEATGAAERARRAGEAFVALTRLAREPESHQMANHDLAWFHLRRGERERALPYFETVVHYVDSLPPRAAYWAGEYFEVIGSLERAEAYFGRGRGTGDSRIIAGLARLAEATGNQDRAIAYARAHDQAGELATYPEFAPLLPGMLTRLGRFAEAEVELAHARERAVGHGQVAAWATLSTDLAVLELRRGHARRAAAVADSAALAATRVAAAEVSLRARAVAGLSLVHTGQAARGLAELRAVVHRIARTRQAQLGAEVLALFGEALAILGQTDRALSTLRRAADLTDSIAASLSLDPSRAGYRSAQLHISNSALETILRHGRERQAAGWFADWSVRRKSRGVVEQGAPRAHPTFETLRRRLTPDQAVIDYVVLDSTVAALVLTGDGPVLMRLPVTSDSLRRRVESLLARLVPRVGTQVDTAHATFDARLAWQLYQDLVAPIEQELGGRTRLTIVPDGPLHLLPFPALVMERTPLQFVLDRYTIALAPSLGFLGDAAQSPVGRLVAVRGSGPVDGSDRELTTVAGAWRVRGAVILRDSGATEAAIRRQAPGAEVLHFAAHARPNDAEPAFAYLQLAPGGADDGLLHAFEIEQLPLAGTLVVLSACETNAGRLLGGEGVLSLSRAFLRAGASGTVATLWPVGPATADVMAAFYRELARGRPTADALREAQLEQRRGRWSNAFHWAGFTLITR